MKRMIIRCVLGLFILVMPAGAQYRVAYSLLSGGVADMTGAASSVMIYGSAGQCTIGASTADATVINTGYYYIIGDLISPVELLPVVFPRSYRLEQNYPNPCNPMTTIGFALPAASDVTLFVYDVIGRPVMSVVDAHFPAGTYRVTMDVSHLPSGVYVYRMTAGPYRASKRLLLLK